MKWLLILPLLASCGNLPFCGFMEGKKPYHNPPTDAVFVKYIKKFNTEMNMSTNISTTFGTMKEKYAGVCHSWTNGHREITINKKHWDNYSDKQREQLIFHELGHCALNREHHNDDTITLNGTLCPDSIMRSKMFNYFEIAYCYNYDYEHYLQEL